VCADGAAAQGNDARGPGGKSERFDGSSGGGGGGGGNDSDYAAAEGEILGSHTFD